MFGIVHFPFFVLSVILLNVTPGPDSAFIVARTVSRGRKAGVVSALGISFGCCAHLCATVLGLTALLAASAQAFTVIKFAGAAYLVYLGLRMLLVRAKVTTGKPADGAGSTVSLRRIFIQAAGTNLLNPKVMLFFVAFFPQFVSPTASSNSLALLALGAVFVVLSTVSNTVLAFAAGALTRRIGASARGRLIV